MASNNLLSFGPITIPQNNLPISQFTSLPAGVSIPTVRSVRYRSHGFPHLKEGRQNGGEDWSKGKREEVPLRLVLKVKQGKNKDKKEENAPVYRLWKETIGERRKNNAFRANRYHGENLY